MPEPLNDIEEKTPHRLMKRYWKIAVLANIKDDNHPKPDGVHRMLLPISTISKQ